MTCGHTHAPKHGGSVTEARSRGDLGAGEAGLPSTCRAQRGRCQREPAQQAPPSHCRPPTRRARWAVCASGLVLRPLRPSQESVTRKPANKTAKRLLLSPVSPGVSVATRVLWSVRSMCDIARGEQSYGCMGWTNTGPPEHRGADSRSLTCTLSAQ